MNNSFQFRLKNVFLLVAMQVHKILPRNIQSRKIKRGGREGGGNKLKCSRFACVISHIFAHFPLIVVIDRSAWVSMSSYHGDRVAHYTRVNLVIMQWFSCPTVLLCSELGQTAKSPVCLLYAWNIVMIAWCFAWAKANVPV